MQRNKRFTYEGFRINVGSAFSENIKCIYVQVPFYIQCDIPLQNAIGSFRKHFIIEMGNWVRANVKGFKTSLFDLDYPVTFSGKINKGNLYIVMEYSIFFDSEVDFNAKAKELKLVGERMVDIAVVWGEWSATGNKIRKPTSYR